MDETYKKRRAVGQRTGSSGGGWQWSSLALLQAKPGTRQALLGGDTRLPIRAPQDRSSVAVERFRIQLHLCAQHRCEEPALGGYRCRRRRLRCEELAAFRHHKRVDMERHEPII